MLEESSQREQQLGVAGSCLRTAHYASHHREKTHSRTCPVPTHPFYPPPLLHTAQPAASSRPAICTHWTQYAQTSPRARRLAFCVHVHRPRSSISNPPRRSAPALLPSVDLSPARDAILHHKDSTLLSEAECPRGGVLGTSHGLRQSVTWRSARRGGAARARDPKGA
jgi:hypothetical protein